MAARNLVLKWASALRINNHERIAGISPIAMIKSASNIAYPLIVNRDLSALFSALTQLPWYTVCKSITQL